MFLGVGCPHSTDRSGSLIGVVQDTPVAVGRADRHVVFNQRVFIQTSLEQLQERTCERCWSPACRMPGFCWTDTHVGVVTWLSPSWQRVRRCFLSSSTTNQREST